MLCLVIRSSSLPSRLHQSHLHSSSSSTPQTHTPFRTLKMSNFNFRTTCRPHTAFSSLVCCRREAPLRIVSFTNPNPTLFHHLQHSRTTDSSFRANQRRTVARASSSWSIQKSPYETLELERDADEEQIKVAYRRLAKCYHPDVYNGKGTLDEGETAEARFIKIQAAYELLVDEEKRRSYDSDNRVNPMKASQAWMDWLIKKRKAFNQRGDMAVAAWAEQQQLELNLRARRLARYKMDPEEERRILAREKMAAKEYFSSTMKRHTLVLKKRDIMRRKAEEGNKNLVSKLLAAEGYELETDDED